MTRLPLFIAGSDPAAVAELQGMLASWAAPDLQLSVQDADQVPGGVAVVVLIASGSLAEATEAVRAARRGQPDAELIVLGGRELEEGIAELAAAGADDCALETGAGWFPLQRAIRLAATRAARRAAQLQAERERAQRLELASQAANVGIVDYRIPTGEASYDERWAAMLGYAAAELAPTLQTWMDLCHPDDRDRVECAVRAVAEAEAGQFEIEYRMRARDGSWRWVLSRGSALEHSAAGTPTRIVGTSLDIHARKLAEIDLQRNRAFLRQVIDLDPSFIFVKDRDGRFHLANKSVADLCGLTPRDIVGRQLAELPFPQSDAERYQETDRAVIDSGEDLFVGEEYVMDASGNGRWVETTKRPFRDVDGEARFVLGISVDITARKRTEQMMAAEREVLELVASNAPIAEVLNAICCGYEDITPGSLCSVLLLDPETRCVRHGAAPHLPEGYRRAIDGAPIGEGVGSCGTAMFRRKPVIVTDIASDPLWGPWAEIALGYGLRACWSVPVLEGENGECLATFAVYYGEERAPAPHEMAFIERLAQLTRIAIEHDRYERRLAEQNERLESLVESRTAELVGANRDLEAFAYSVSHDLRTPLRGIDGFSQALLEEYGDRLDATGRNYLHRVRRAAQRLGDLIDDMLTLSRVTRHEMRSESVSLSRLAHEIVEELHRSEPHRVVDVVIAEDCLVQGDPFMLRVMMENLLSNAWKFTRGREPARIEFGCSNRAEGEYFVRDNGVGFDMNYASKLFFPFQRLHSLDEFEGTGIGLASVSRIVARHGGRIQVNAAVGAGATFHVSLPRVKS